MKTRLLYILLLVSSITMAQNWSQVGNAQFSDFAADVGKIAFNPNNGDVYVLYKKPTSTGLYVMKYDGTTWANVGTTSVSNNSTTYNTYAININPTTNEPWVVLKRAASGAASSHDVFKFDGTNWVQQANGIAGSSYNNPTQIYFSSLGLPRFTRVISAGNSERKLGFVSGSSFNNWTETFDALQDYNYYYDYTGYVEFFVCSDNNKVRRRGYGSTASVFGQTYVNKNFRAISGIAGTNYFVAYSGGINGTGSLFFDDGTNASFNQPLSGVTAKTNKHLKFRKSDTDNNFYLMYNNTSDEIKFKKYNTTTFSWSNLPNANINSSNANFFIDSGINPHNGNLYVMYLDGGKVSVKQFNILTPQSLPRIYVNTAATGNNTGESWTNAFTSVADALASVQNITTEIWVATGTYTPGTSRTDTFTINANNLAIYGGFNGTETAINQRNILANPTILSGDLQGNDTPLIFNSSNTTRHENSYHVVTVDANNIVIDGVKIEDGYANGTATGHNYGASINIVSTTENLTVRNCELNDNLSLAGGMRAFFTVNTQLNIENCIFNNNLSRYASGLYVLANINTTLTVNITNSLFTNNKSFDIYTSASGFTGSSAWIRANGINSNITTNIVNCTFANNTDNGNNSSSTRGTLALSRESTSFRTHNVNISNTIFYGNKRNGNTTSSVNRGHKTMPNTVFVNNSIGEDNFSNLNTSNLTNTNNANPLFTGANNNNFTLQTGSPAIDTGDNSKVPTGITTDLAGNARISNAVVDMGCYEFGSVPLHTNSIDSATTFMAYPNPVNNVLNLEHTTNITAVRVYNLLGQAVSNQNVNATNAQIDMSRLNTGTYIVAITIDNTVKTIKVIKK